jgi:hypothetical protein
VCDFRKIISVVIDGEEIPVEYKWGEADFRFEPPEPNEPGIYHIGASGCGMYYWSGEAWYADYYDEDTEKVKACKYITDGSMDLLIDTKNFNIG